MIGGYKTVVCLQRVPQWGTLITTSHSVLKNQERL